MTATNAVSRTRSPESATAVRRRWPAMFADTAHVDADRVVDPASSRLQGILDEESGWRGVDVVIVAAPVHNARETALKLAAICGQINYFGGLPKVHPTISFNSNLVHYKELVVTGTTACSTADCWQATQIANSGFVDMLEVTSQCMPLSEAVNIFATAGDRLSLKIILEP